MPLLLCPNDNGPMQTVQRSGVEFDICPTCRGVWLDRGELEKLLAFAREAESGHHDDRREGWAQGGYDPRPMGRPEGRRGWGDDDDDDDYGRNRGGRRSIFDIFGD
ncbi:MULTISPECIES: zf-TFIIB domain-containing protein [Rhodomicrobium]|uniref:TFIIB-type zinc ribbon-containing protein n=1 Tax=Rhodomicrobium TaxID=1068 RepID=UPI000B4AB670|nr:MULTISPECIES: zf-TFIIB domain-containing protein [Rhodomicrobium]